MRTLAELPPPALVDGDLRLTSDEVLTRAAAIAGGLAARGVRPGDVVAFQLPNWWEAVVLLHACWRLGAVAAPLHHRLTAEETDRLYARLDPRLVVVGAPFEQPQGAIVVRDRADGFAALTDTPLPTSVSHVEADDLALLLVTSGSTGAPKVVQHTHGALAYKARTMVDAHGVSSNDVVLMPAPMGHVSGVQNGVLIPGAAGMTTVLESRWDPQEAADLIVAESVSFMIGPPTYFLDLMEVGRPLASLRLISCGGAGVTPAFVGAAREALGAWVKRTYGSTEAPTVTTWQPGDPPELAAVTDGRPVADAELRVIHPSYGGAQAVNEVGAILVRGPELFVGYDDPAATTAVLDDEGWFRTGDLGRIDPDGWLTVTGREADVIIRGGENISPTEVEDACVRMPGVRQAVVVGYPDARLGQRVALVATADRDIPLEAVREHCVRVGLTGFKLPERVLIVEAIPVLAAGKPDRAGLAALVAERS